MNWLEEDRVTCRRWRNWVERNDSMSSQGRHAYNLLMRNIPHERKLELYAPFERENAPVVRNLSK